MLARRTRRNHPVRHARAADPMLPRRTRDHVRHADPADPMLARRTGNDHHIRHANPAHPVLTKGTYNDDLVRHACPADAMLPRRAAARRLLDAPPAVPVLAERTAVGPHAGLVRAAGARGRDERHEFADALLAACIGPLAGRAAHAALGHLAGEAALAVARRDIVGRASQAASAYGRAPGSSSTPVWLGGPSSRADIARLLLRLRSRTGRSARLQDGDRARTRNRLPFERAARRLLDRRRGWLLVSSGATCPSACHHLVAGR